MNCLVECHSGYTYAERPMAVYWDGSRHEIDEILSRWRTPEGPAFQVRTTDGEVLSLLYQEQLDQWVITTSNSPGFDHGV